ncbi:hypothetical protein AB4865_06260 [Capnocytophaga sp. ARDL2]|uniref:hypothetical protein n=1 Tax=Capnocytophaga sp. ARDL2 TaxID=3238809 RepID=UPI0035579207
MKQLILLMCLITSISCSEEKNDKMIYENVEIFVKENGSFEDFFVIDDEFYILTNKSTYVYSEPKDRYIETDVKVKLFSKGINESYDKLEFITEFNEVNSARFLPQMDNTSICFFTRDLNYGKSDTFYKYSSGIITKLFEHENHIVWYDAVQNLFYDGYSLYKVQGNEKIKLTEKSTNSSYQLFGEKIYKLSEKGGITQLEELDASLETKKIIFSTDKKLNLDFRISDSVTFYFLQGTTEGKINLVQYRKNSFTTLMDNIDNISDDGFYVYKDLIGLITYKVDESMLGGFGGTRKSVIYSKDAGKVFNELNLEKGTLVPPYIFYKDSLFVGNLGNGILAKANL